MKNRHGIEGCCRALCQELHWCCCGNQKSWVFYWQLPTTPEEVKSPSSVRAHWRFIIFFKLNSTNKTTAFFLFLVGSDDSSHCLQPLQWNLGTLGPCCAITVLSKCAGVGADSWAVLCAVCRVWWPWGLTQGRWTWAVGWGGVSTLLSLPARCEALGSLLFS